MLTMIARIFQLCSLVNGTTLSEAPGYVSIEGYRESTEGIATALKNLYENGASDARDIEKRVNNHLGSSLMHSRNSFPAVGVSSGGTQSADTFFSWGFNSESFNRVLEEKAVLRSSARTQVNYLNEATKVLVSMGAIPRLGSNGEISVSVLFNYMIQSLTNIKSFEKDIAKNIESLLQEVVDVMGVLGKDFDFLNGKTFQNIGAGLENTRNLDSLMKGCRGHKIESIKNHISVIMDNIRPLDTTTAEMTIYYNAVNLCVLSGGILDCMHSYIDLLVNRTESALDATLQSYANVVTSLIYLAVPKGELSSFLVSFRVGAYPIVGWVSNLFSRDAQPDGTYFKPGQYIDHLSSQYNAVIYGEGENVDAPAVLLNADGASDPSKNALDNQVAADPNATSEVNPNLNAVLDETGVRKDIAPGIVVTDQVSINTDKGLQIPNPLDNGKITGDKNMNNNAKLGSNEKSNAKSVGAAIRSKGDNDGQPSGSDSLWKPWMTWCSVVGGVLLVAVPTAYYMYAMYSKEAEVEVE